MKIYTTYFAKLKQLPSDICVVSIAAKQPDPSFSNMAYTKLAPPWYVLKEHKETGDESKYVEQYKKLVLANMDPRTVIEALQRRGQGRDVALVCYEKAGSFCHRNLVAEWLRNAGYEVEEWR